MSEIWERVAPLREISEFVRDGTHASFQRVSHGKPLLSAKNITEGGDIAWDSSDSLVSEADYRTISRSFRITRGDVLLTIVGSIGRVALCRNDDAVAFQRSVAVIRPRSDLIDPDFLAHLLRTRSVQSELLRRANATAQAGVYLGELDQVLIPVPSLVEQRKIAEILDTADEAIRSTERLIGKLERARRGLLQDLLTRGVDETGSLRDLDHDPAAFARTRLGPRPANWSVLQVEDLIQGRPRNGYSPKEVDQWTGILMLGLGCLTQDGYRPLQLKNAPLGDPALQQAILNDGDLLISRSNTHELVGLSGRFRTLGVPCTYPDLMMRITPNRRVLPEYLEIVLRAPDTRRQIQAAASGTSGSMVKISSSVVCNLLVAIPDEAEQRRIIAVLDAGTSRSESEECRLAKLRCLKQGLMDDLMSGRIRVGASG